MLNVAAASRAAARWLGPEAGEDGHTEELADALAIYVRAGDGRAALVDSVGRVLVAAACVPFVVHLADFRAGWRSDFLAGAL